MLLFHNKWNMSQLMSEKKKIGSFKDIGHDSNEGEKGFGDRLSIS